LPKSFVTSLFRGHPSAPQLLGRQHGAQSHKLICLQQASSPNKLFGNQYGPTPARMRLSLPIGVLALYWSAVASADDGHATPSPDSIKTIEPILGQNVRDSVQNPMQMGAMAIIDIPVDWDRHQKEEAHLMKRMNRKNGKWNSSHPRYRLLEALFSYSKYRDTNMAELDRWRSLYRNVGKKQKKASQSS
jgi:hypothetical protein